MADKREQEQRTDGKPTSGREAKPEHLKDIPTKDTGAEGENVKGGAAFLGSRDQKL